jgi:hypothetical protein
VKLLNLPEKQKKINVESSTLILVRVVVLEPTRIATEVFENITRERKFRERTKQNPISAMSSPTTCRRMETATISRTSPKSSRNQSAEQLSKVDQSPLDPMFSQKVPSFGLVGWRVGLKKTKKKTKVLL